MAEGRVNILIVDDRPENLLALENILRSPELNIVKADSGNEALAKLLEFDFACVLLDVKMPDMDGFELARIVRADERTRYLPIIFSSGNQRTELDVFKGYETGAVDYLLKPLDPTIVRSKVKVFADLYRKSEALKLAETKMASYASELKVANQELETRVTERMKELSHSREQMAQLQKMDAIGSLAGGMAHDFNNLLAAINIYCDNAIENTRNPDAMIETINEIRDVAARGAALTRQLLIFSRKQVVQPKALHLNLLVKSMLNMLRRLIDENIEITTTFGQELAFILADPGQIEQIILNLVVNARDAMKEGGTVNIKTSNILLTQEFADAHLSSRIGQHVVLSVSDTGMGMDEATRQRLFEPFFTTKPVGKGTGLGLSTVYGIVKQIGGTIWVSSEPGKGSVFKIYFPITADTDKTVAAAPSAKIQSSGGDASILLVEDDKTLRQLYGQVLTRRGYKVLLSSNGTEALEMIADPQNKIDLLISDIVMPQMGGFELARRALERRPELPILFMSGYAGENLDDQDLSVRAHAISLQKPFSVSDLVARIQEILK